MIVEKASESEIISKARWHEIFPKKQYPYKETTNFKVKQFDNNKIFYKTYNADNPKDWAELHARLSKRTKKIN